MGAHNSNVRSDIVGIIAAAIYIRRAAFLTRYIFPRAVNQLAICRPIQARNYIVIYVKITITNNLKTPIQNW